MKNIEPKLIELFKTGYCTPQIAQIAKKLKEPSTTIHYNIKRLEKEGKIKAYSAIFDYKKIDEGHCTYILVNLIQEKYGNPEEVAKMIAKDSKVESVDICTGDWELVLKVRTKDQDEFYNLVKNVISREGIIKIKSLTSLKQIKTEFVEL